MALAIEYLSRNVAESASKLSKIIDLLNMSIGAFEYDKADRKVYCTEGMLFFLNVPSDSDGYLAKEVFDQRLKQLKYVKNFRLGTFGEGEDGVTIVSLE